MQPQYSSNDLQQQDEELQYLEPPPPFLLSLRKSIWDYFYMQWKHHIAKKNYNNWPESKQHL